MNKMHSPRRLLVAALLAGAIPAVALAQQSIGVNSAIRNQVQMKTASDSALRAARLKEDVHLNDQVQTGAASQLQVLLKDRSVFTVGPNARMSIDRFVYDPNRGTGEVAASVARGAFRFVSGGPSGAGGKSISTPAGSIGIRGTIVEGVAGPDALTVLEGEGLAPFTGNPDNAVLVVLRGPGGNTRGFDTPGAVDFTQGGQTIELNRAGQAFLLGGGGPANPFILSDAALDRLSELLRPVATGSNAGVGSAGAGSGTVFDTGLEQPLLTFNRADIDLPLLEDHHHQPEYPEYPEDYCYYHPNDPYCNG